MNAPSHERPLDDDSMAAADAVHAAMRFLRVLRYRKSYVITSLVVAGLLGAVYYLTATRIYQASASLLVTQTGPDVWNTSMTPDGARDASIPTYERLFSSAVVLEGAVERLLKTPAAIRIDLAEEPRDKWVDVLRDHLSARAIRRTNIIELSYRSKSPEGAEAIVEAIVESYMDFMDKNHKDVSIELVKILDEERKVTAAELQEKQEQLLDIKREAGVVLREGTEIVHPIVQRVIELNRAVVDVQKERVQLEASFAAIRVAIRNHRDLRQHLINVEPLVGRELIMSALGLDPQSAEAAAGINRQLLADRAKLQMLRGYYGPTHHEIQQLEQSILNAEQYLMEHRFNVNNLLDRTHEDQLAPMLVSMVEEKLANAWEHERKLGQQFEDAEAEAMQLNDSLANLQIVQNEEQRLRNLHDTLLDRISNIDLKQNRTDMRVAIVSEATASKHPISPKRSLIGLLCLIGGLGVGGAVVYVLDLLDDRFRSPDELKEQTGVPLLAMVRKLSTTSDGGAESLHVHTSPTSVETESFRTLRTTLAFSGQDMQCVAVTSSEPGDGKTTVLANLGVSYAQAGKRTLLIDADLRRPGLTRLFLLRGSDGLSETLRSDDAVAALCESRIQPSGVEGLEILPSGARPPDPAEILSGPRFADLLAWAETQYDQVLVDCPPVMAASDAAIVGRLVNGMLLVVQPDKNHRRSVLRAAEDLATIGANLAGIVANRIGDEKEGGYYGYGSKYGYGYGYGYGHDEEDLPQEQDADSQDGSRSDSVVPRRAA